MGAPIDGGFSFKGSGLMLVDHKERIDGGNVSWCGIGSDAGDKNVSGMYSIYREVNGSQVLMEWGRITKVRMGYKASGSSKRHTEISCDRTVQVESLQNYTLYSLVISGLF